MKRVGLLTILLLAGVIAANAAITFKIGPTFNFFDNRQLSGIDNTVGIAFDFGKEDQIGIRIEQQNLVVTNADGSRQNNRMSNQLYLFTWDRQVANITKELPVTIGLELGSIQTESLPGTVAARPTLDQVSPVFGLNGGLKYEIAGKVITTAILFNLGYRFIELNDVFLPVGTSLQPVKDLNGLRLDLGVAATF